jgi:hypothetical protein
LECGDAASPLLFIVRPDAEKNKIGVEDNAALQIAATT